MLFVSQKPQESHCRFGFSFSLCPRLATAATPWSPLGQRARASAFGLLRPLKKEKVQMPKEEISPVALAQEAYWDAEYNFWHKIITGEVERLRFNEGFEPVEVDLYPTSPSSKNKFVGLCQIGHRHFRAVAFEAFDAKGNKVLRLQIHVQP
jgi:hypothetical protein